MIKFILNNELIETDAPSGTAMLDFIRKNQQLKGAKLVCKEGECGACSAMVGQLINGKVAYQSMTSCIMPLINANGKHIVTVEGFNMNKLSPVQQALVDTYGSQCGFCTPGFVVSMSGYLLSNSQLTKEGIIESMDGNICRCTGYKSIERAADIILKKAKRDFKKVSVNALADKGYLPSYFKTIPKRLAAIKIAKTKNAKGVKLGGGSDLYVQKPWEMYEKNAVAVYDNPAMNKITVKNGVFEFGAALTMGDLYRSPEFNKAIPNDGHMFKLLSSTQIRNMSTIGGNLINASPIGDFTCILLGLDASIVLNKNGKRRTVALNTFYKGYKKMEIKKEEILEKVKFKIPSKNTTFHFEKVSQRKYLDIATVNFSSSITLDKSKKIKDIHLAVGGVGPIPMYLHTTVKFLKNKEMSSDTIDDAIEVLQNEITPISDTRGSADYKRLVARQLFLAQFLNLDANIYDVKKLVGAW